VRCKRQLRSLLPAHSEKATTTKLDLISNYCPSLMTCRLAHLERWFRWCLTIYDPSSLGSSHHQPTRAWHQAAKMDVRNSDLNRLGIGSPFVHHFWAFCFAHLLRCPSAILARAPALNVRRFAFGSSIIRTVFSATASVMNWFRDIPSFFAPSMACSRVDAGSRNAKLVGPCVIWPVERQPEVREEHIAMAYSNNRCSSP